MKNYYETKQVPISLSSDNNNSFKITINFAGIISGSYLLTFKASLIFAKPVRILTNNRLLVGKYNFFFSKLRNIIKLATTKSTYYMDVTELPVTVQHEKDIA